MKGTQYYQFQMLWCKHIFVKERLAQWRFEWGMCIYVFPQFSLLFLGVNKSVYWQLCLYISTGSFVFCFFNGNCFCFVFGFFLAATVFFFFFFFTESKGLHNILCFMLWPTSCKANISLRVTYQVNIHQFKVWVRDQCGLYYTKE